MTVEIPVDDQDSISRLWDVFNCGQVPVTDPFCGREYPALVGIESERCAAGDPVQFFVFEVREIEDDS